MKNQQGVTLLELMIVVAVIAIISMFAVPTYQDAQRKSRISEGVAALTEAQSQIEKYRLANRQSYTKIIDDNKNDLTKLGINPDVYYSSKIIYKITLAAPTKKDINDQDIPNPSAKYILTATADIVNNKWIGKDDESCILIMNGSGALTKTVCPTK